MPGSCVASPPAASPSAHSRRRRRSRASALTALLVGLILWIGQALGTGWAILIVIGVTLLVAGALGWFGTVKLRDALSSEDGV